MVDAKELGERVVVVPVLERVSGGRHDFNRIDAWQTGRVVLASRHSSPVTGVDRGTKNVLLRDEEGRMRYYSPAELNATEIEVFRQEKLSFVPETASMSKTWRDMGHAAHEQYRVSALRDNGDIVLSGAAGEKVINPGEIQADRHIDYAWAVTGYGAQAASSRFVIALESALGRRGVMSGMRAFYISLSRAKEHVQVYTDSLQKWVEYSHGRIRGLKRRMTPCHPRLNVSRPGASGQWGKRCQKRLSAGHF
jgi:hypothetical protein